MSGSDKKYDTAQDTANSALISDHGYEAEEGKFLCKACGLGQATHSTSVTPYVSSAPHALPERYKEVLNSLEVTTILGDLDPSGREDFKRLTLTALKVYEEKFGGKNG